MKEKHSFIDRPDTELEALLTSQLYRYDCATPDQLQQYAWDMLATEAANQIEQHCHYCADCRQAVAQHEEIIQNAATIELMPLLSMSEQLEPEKLTEKVTAKSPASDLITDAKEKLHQVQVFVAKLLNDFEDGVGNVVGSLTPAPQPAYGALRGGVTGRSLLYEAGGAMIDLQLRVDQEPSVMLSGQIMGLDTSQSAGQTGERATGRFRLTPQSNSADKSITGNLSEHGSFSADEVQPGDYQLTIELSDATYTILDLAVD